MGLTSAGLMLRTGSSSLPRCASRLLVPVSSLRSLARSQPFWTKVSLPSGRTSLTVAWRSTLGVDERTHSRTAPAPTTVVSCASGADTYETAVPAGFCAQRQSQSGAFDHRPPVLVFEP